MEPQEDNELSTPTSPSILVEHPYSSFDELLFERLRMEALNEMERSIRYTLDINDDLSSITGGFFRHGMFGALADLTGASIISHLFEYFPHAMHTLVWSEANKEFLSPVTPGPVLDMQLSVQSALQPPATVRIESRVKRHGDTLAFVSTRFYTDEKPIARAKTTHYIASSSARRRPEPHDSS